jgi:hypothetical protein
MDAERAGEVLENLDRRVGAIEQILPNLATKEDLQPLATKEELRQAVALLATKEEVREEGAASRRYMKMLAEEIKSEIALYAENLTALDARDARQHADGIKRHVALEKRVAALEAPATKRRRRE